MAIWLPERDVWTSQPNKVPQISSQWHQDVVFACLPGIAPVDIVRSVTATRYGTIPVVASSIGALSTDPSSVSNTRFSWENLKPVNSMGDGYSMMLYARPFGGSRRRAFYLGAEAASAYTGALIGFNMNKSTTLTNLAFAFVEYSSTLRATADATSMIDGEWHIWHVNRPFGVSAPVLYRDGVNVTSSSTSNGGAALTSGVHLHGVPTSTGDGMPEEIALAVVFRRTLPEPVIFSLAKNPWQLFE